MILIQYSKQVVSNSAKNSKSDQDSLPNLVIYAMPQGRTVHLRKTQDPNTSGSQPTDLPFQQSNPLDPSSSEQDQQGQDLCREILMSASLRFRNLRVIPRSISTSTTTTLMISTSTFMTTWKLLLQSQKPRLSPWKIHPLHPQQ